MNTTVYRPTLTGCTSIAPDAQMTRNLRSHQGPSSSGPGPDAAKKRKSSTTWPCAKSRLLSLSGLLDLQNGVVPRPMHDRGYTHLLKSHLLQRVPSLTAPCSPSKSSLSYTRYRCYTRYSYDCYNIVFTSPSHFAASYARAGERVCQSVHPGVSCQSLLRAMHEQVHTGAASKDRRSSGKDKVNPQHPTGDDWWFDQIRAWPAKPLSWECRL